MLAVRSSELAEYDAVFHTVHNIPRFNISPTLILLPWRNISAIKRRTIEAITSRMTNGPEAVAAVGAAAETQRPTQAQIHVSIQRQI